MTIESFLIKDLVYPEGEVICPLNILYRTILQDIDNSVIISYLNTTSNEVTVYLRQCIYMQLTLEHIIVTKNGVKHTIQYNQYTASEII